MEKLIKIGAKVVSPRPLRRLPDRRCAPGSHASPPSAAGGGGAGEERPMPRGEWQGLPFPPSAIFDRI